MTEPLLSYQTPIFHRSGIHTAAWIMLLILGILYGLLTILMGLMFGMFIMFALSFGVGRTNASDFFFAVLIIGLMVGVPMAASILNIWCAVLVRKFSARAALVAISTNLVLAILMGGLACLILVLGVLTLLENSHFVEPALVTFFYGVCFLLATAAHGVEVWLLVRTRREIRLAIGSAVA